MRVDIYHVTAITVQLILSCHVFSSRCHRPWPSTCQVFWKCHCLSQCFLSSRPARCRRPLPPPSLPPRRPTRGTGSVWPPLLLCQLNTTRRTIRATESPGTRTGRGSARSRAVPMIKRAGRPPRRSEKREFFQSFSISFHFQ